ncbi:phenylacetate-CoA oxygenase subunit PaaJ [Hyphococcus flavus]|uniref:Phenylacetate-CoA oxygenase subunit PaaJ n=1 Tax=Hyphococcus flavus TaxID=1866326 RepID=A0AAF0CE47_9PROT|nr:1,2-phenylacetyl-CoA epoxidase subunit PaaD [Hyphococcus flavus]WDI30686.1 phenylacetate-CoA oxygenase subunit PaaJ [Hyphococcus flavus]
MAEANVEPSIDEVWRWLEDVPDPEIPVVSVVDLGIVRDAAWERDELVVTVTPTYSGCPATAVISFEIEESLRRKGVEKIRIKTQLSPAWTTDWITGEAREKLRQYGIAPPVGEASCAGALKASGPVACPHCGSENTSEVSRFGSTPCKASWRCNDCLEPFDYFKSF